MEPVRFGLVGYGRFGAQHAKALAAVTDSHLAAIAARSEDTCAAAKTAHPDADVYDDYRQLIARQDIQVVSVVVPTYLHFQIGKAVLEAGKHLLIEKPMAMNLDECRELNALAKSGGQVLAVNFKRRVAHLWRRVKEMVDDGAIGTPLFAHIGLWRWPYRLGAGGWRYDPKRVGSWILEEPVHAFDKARWYFADAGDPASVYAVANSVHANSTELTDNFSAVVQFERGGQVTITQTLCAFGHHHTVGLTGTAGAILATWSGARDSDAKPSASLQYRKSDSEEVEQIVLASAGDELSELQSQVSLMIEAIGTGAPAIASGVDGAWAVGLCEAAQKSIVTGDVISTQNYRP
jgi:myo-inositol 2-dehydrogenase/D-chiro-inositol 1-dehydrogenase